MIGIAAPAYDVDGALILSARLADARGAERRATITKTLDGGSVVYDNGFCITDETLQATVAYPSFLLLEQLRYLIERYPRLIVSLDTGCYESVVSMAGMAHKVTLSFRLITEIS